MRLVPKPTYLEELERYLIREEQIQILNQKQANLKLLGPAEKLCSESELSFNRWTESSFNRRTERSLQAQSKTSIGSPKPNLRKDNLSSEKGKEHLASSARHTTSYVTLGKLISN